jgi:protein-arginine kinase activator protein McsA
MFTQLTPSTSNGEWKTQTKVSEDGTMKITTYYYDNSKTNPTSKNLKQQLEIAIENEDFEKAVELRDQIKKLESNQKEIDKLEEELKKSIEEQNFEKSIEIRDQLKKLK